jgi:hypothetical protein
MAGAATFASDAFHACVRELVNHNVNVRADGSS